MGRHSVFLSAALPLTASYTPGGVQKRESCIFEKAWKAKDLQEVINHENDATSDALRLVESLEQIHVMYNHAGSNDEVEFGFSRVAVT